MEYRRPTYRLLSSTINKGSNRPPIDLHWDAKNNGIRASVHRIRIEAWDVLEHRNPTKALWRVFHGVFQVFHHSLEPNCLFDLALCLDVIRVCVQSSNFPLSGHLRLVMASTLLTQENCEMCRIILSCCCNVWLCLYKGVRFRVRPWSRLHTCCSSLMRFGSPSMRKRIISASCSTVLERDSGLGTDARFPELKLHLPTSHNHLSPQQKNRVFSHSRGNNRGLWIVQIPSIDRDALVRDCDAGLCAQVGRS